MANPFGAAFNFIGQLFNPGGAERLRPKPEVVPVAPPRPTPAQLALEELTVSNKEFATIQRRLSGTRYEPLMDEIATVCAEIYAHIGENKTGQIPKTHFNDFYLKNFNTLFLLLTASLGDTAAGGGELPSPVASGVSFPVLTADTSDKLPRTVPAARSQTRLNLSFLAEENKLAGPDYLDWLIKIHLIEKLEADPELSHKYALELVTLREETSQRLDQAKATLASIQHTYAGLVAAHHGSTAQPVQFSGTNGIVDNDLKLLLAADEVPSLRVSEDVN